MPNKLQALHPLVEVSKTSDRKIQIALIAGLCLLWLAMQGWLWQRYQVKVVPDSTFRYIPYATEFAENGVFRGGHDDRYLLYIIYLTFFIKVGLGLTGAVLGQVAVSGLATVCFYRIARQLTNGNLIVAAVSTALFICWKDIQYLNYYILTESLFTSSILFVFYLLTISKTKVGDGLVLLAGVLTCTLRPNGFIVLLSAIAYMVVTYWPQLKKHQTKIAITLFSLGIVLLLILDRFLLTTFDLIGTYIRGEVIYASDIYSVALPETLQVPPLHYSSLTRLFLFVAAQPVFFFKMFFSKLFLFFAYAKPYYSAFHIVSIYIVVYSLYLFAVRYLVSAAGHTPSKAFAVVLFVLQASIVAATSEDWDSRFLIPLLPVAFLIGFAGINKIIRRRQAQRVLTPPPPSAA